MNSDQHVNVIFITDIFVFEFLSPRVEDWRDQKREIRTHSILGAVEVQFQLVLFGLSCEDT